MYAKVASSLDWNWSDYARFLTCTIRPGLTAEVVKISDGGNSLRFTLFECLADKTGDLDHPVYSLYTLEAELDLGASILLAFGGYYKQAGVCLRSFLELAFLSIYYADHREEYSRWKIGEAKSPPFHARDASVLEYLFKETKLKDHQELKKEASSLYLELNQFVHTGGIDKLDLWRCCQDMRNTSSVAKTPLAQLIFRRSLEQRWSRILRFSPLIPNEAAF